MNKQKLRIAMLEDDSDDCYLTNEVLAELDSIFRLISFPVSFNCLRNQFITSRSAFGGLNATPQNGIEVLRMLKANKISEL